MAAALLAIRDGLIPPTINADRPAEGCELPLVRGRSTAARVRTALVVARGFGGFNARRRRGPTWSLPDQ